MALACASGWYGGVGLHAGTTGACAMTKMDLAVAFNSNGKQSAHKQDEKMTAPQVWTFFYGSYINFGVLEELGLVPEQWEVARLRGYDIRIEPRANLVRADQHCVYGIVAT